jgi:hypothetical protein
MQGWCCAGGNRAHQLAEMNSGGRNERERRVGQPDRSRKEAREGRREGGKREEESQRTWGGTRGQEYRVGRWYPVPGSPSTLVWGWVSVHFVFLHTV